MSILKRSRRVPVAASLLLSALTVYLGYVVQRPDFWALLAGYVAFFSLYAAILYRRDESVNAQRWWIGTGIALRILLLLSVPNLSDDFYRFLWDGRLLAQGIHPFSHPPVYFWENKIAVPGLDAVLYEGLNSARFYTVYPPVCQAVFWLAAVLSPTGLSGGVLVMKLFLLACDIGTIRLLWRHFSMQGAVVYALNPLAILEVTGNIHFEGAMAFFMLLALTWLPTGPSRPDDTRYGLPTAALWWALATASKLLPLLFVPVIWAGLGLRRGWYWACWCGGWCVLLFAPLLQPAVVRHMLDSIELYFNQFEFNAGGYYLLKYTAIALTGNPYLAPKIGTWTACLTVIGILGLAWNLLRRPAASCADPLVSALLWASTLYLLLTSTVHPWYVVIPLALGCATGRYFPVAWSGVVILSYSHYIGGGLRENFVLIGLQYVLLTAFIIGEGLMQRKKS